MIIPADKWKEASGGYVQDGQGGLWRIIGFIDRPSVILDPVGAPPGGDDRQRQVIVMGSPLSEDYVRLVPEGGGMAEAPEADREAEMAPAPEPEPKPASKLGGGAARQLATEEGRARFIEAIEGGATVAEAQVAIGGSAGNGRPLKNARRRYPEFALALSKALEARGGMAFGATCRQVRRGLPAILDDEAKRATFLEAIRGGCTQSEALEKIGYTGRNRVVLTNARKRYPEFSLALDQAMEERGSLNGRRYARAPEAVPAPRPAPPPPPPRPQPAPLRSFAPPKRPAVVPTLPETREIGDGDAFQRQLDRVAAGAGIVEIARIPGKDYSLQTLGGVGTGQL